MKILVITPKLPWPATGADEADRLEGIKFLIELGHEVRVIAKVAPYQEGKGQEMSDALGVSVTTVPYTKGGWSWKRLRDLRYLDGAAYEYTEPQIRHAVDEALAAWKPDRVWIDASFSWPLIPLCKRAKVPTIVRSLQIESTHILVDEGWSLPNLARALGKHLGEIAMARTADRVVAINRDEAKSYAMMGATRVTTIPLRSLPSVLAEPPIEYRDATPIHVLYSASTFSVAHNLAGAMKVFREIAPELERRAPGTFVIHVTGGKLPDQVKATLPTNVVYEGYVPDYGAFINTMDVAITPSLGRVGMHQKLFEPVARGMPTVTVPWALAGYPVGEAVVLARTSREFVDVLLRLQSVSARKTLGEKARTFAEEYVSHSRIMKDLVDCFE